MCIKSAPYLHLKNANRSLDMELFNALMLILLTKFAPFSNAPLEGFFSGYFFYCDAKLAPNAM